MWPLKEVEYKRTGYRCSWEVWMGIVSTYYGWLLKRVWLINYSKYAVRAIFGNLISDHLIKSDCLTEGCLTEDWFVGNFECC